ncbi:MAG: hypothetical protein WD227_16580, partial [Vicinamibacterales bacterium]
NPDISNPDISNPDISNGSLTDVTWTVTNTGNTTSNYDVNVLNGVTVPQQIKTQLIVHKTYTTPVSDGCTLKYQTQTVLVASIVNPHLDTTGALADLSLWLEPGANGKITLRVVDPDPGDQITFNPLSAETPVAPTVESTAVNTANLEDPVPTPPSSTPPLVTSTTLEIITGPSSALVSTSLGDVTVLLKRTVDGVPSPLVGASVATGILTNPSGGQLSGQSTVTTDVNGVATFSALSIDRGGQGYQLAFTAAAAGAVPVPSAFFTITTPAAPDPTQNVFVVTTTADSGTGSLRQAMLDANARANGDGGPDVITFGFRLPEVYTITLASALPVITQPLIIDGTTQVGYNPDAGQPRIHVAGPGTNDFSGFVIGSTAPDSAIKGLSLTGFGLLTPAANIAAIRVGAASVVIEGNWLGIKPDGTPVANQIGIWISDGSAIVGGTGGPSTRNVISAGRTGIYASASTGSTILGNFIGTSPDGLIARSNSNFGMSLATANVTNTVIGGPVVAGGFFGPDSPANLIAGNAGGGIQLVDVFDDSIAGPTGTRILGNQIGLAADGTDLGNAGFGIRVVSASGTQIGEPGAGNVISGNGSFDPAFVPSPAMPADPGFVFGPGILVGNGQSGPPAVRPLIRSNLIGVDPLGTTARPNAYAGIRLDAPATVGGTGQGEGNLIAGNGQSPWFGTGIAVNAPAGGSMIQGNTIGLGANGAPLGNGYSGITVHGPSAGAEIGGSVPGARNVISGNAHAGVAIYTTNASLPQNVLVKGNYIGTDATGAVAGVGNGVFGISVSHGTGHVFGGDTAADGNVIAGNGGPGVGVTGPDTQAAILSNRIFQNAGLGIDLGANGVTVNDPGDGDSGPNGLLNHPTLVSANRNATAGTTVIPVTFTAAPGVTYRLQFFTNAACDGTHGEGAQLFHEENIMPATGDVTSVVNAPLVPEGTVLTATLTAFSGGTGVTSEFSACRTATTPEPPVSVGPVGGGGGSAFAISCGSDFAATALRGRAGDDIDRTELWCAPKTSLATSATLFGSVGGDGGTDYGSQLTCPSGSAMTGIHGRAGEVLWGGNVVDTLGVVCTNPVTSAVVSSAAVGNAAPLAVPFTLSCPAGKQVIGIFGGQGGLLDRIGIVCQ